MNHEEKLDFLTNIELFETLTEEELAQIAEKMRIHNLPPGTIIFRENEKRESVYLIYSGEVELIKKTVFNENARLAIFKKNDFLGESTLIEDTAHSTTAGTITNCIILYLHKEEFQEASKDNQEIFIKVIRKIAQVISRRMSLSNAKIAGLENQYRSSKYRKEHDLLGEKDVPHDVYYGIQTLRAIENFNISGVPLSFHPDLTDGLVMVKKATAKSNQELGILDENIAFAIDTACTEILNGRYRKHFMVDMIQGGAGTSTNMNVNEVIANRALEIMGRQKGEYEYCHPNNHVNLSQSTNDVYPTAIKIALLLSNKKLVKVLMDLISSIRDKAEEFSDVIKMGRTQLQDAVPMTLGQSFEAYAITLEEEIDNLTRNANLFLEVNMGATAIGTGINTDPKYRRLVVGYLREITGMDIVSARNLMEATQDTSAFVMYSSAIKRLSLKLSKMSSDLRLLSSGPRCGLNEINLPPMQPGSSIMPGKVNPVIPEVINQIAYKVTGNDLTVTLAVEAGQLELNVMEPVIVQSLFESIEILKNGMSTLMFRCINGITANKEHCRAMVMNSIGLVTALSPVLGYEACSSLAKEAIEKDKRVYDLVLEKKILSKEALDKFLKPENMIKPHVLKPNSK